MVHSACMDGPICEELVQLCRSITDDGELTDKELYTLADWINKYPHIQDHWPATILIEPLQKVWADGKITRTELKQVAKLLARIEREWARDVEKKEADEGV